ncbi:MAG: glycogen/starch/alpha-glucan phosphorylase [Erysipelothrix sp.]|jgi:starch phosphorylase|nr:glycogen/starch/alpha-glucan phosphorylase [Erysipelothrix sp.]
MFQNKHEFKRDFIQRIEETYGRSIAQSHKTERYMVLGEMVRDYASIHWKANKERIADVQAKQMYYFSMEFLIGRLLTSNLMNLGIYDIVKDGLSELSIDINELELLESDAGLGNGGLGRLAACFMDSLASLSLPGHGITLRYEYGLFQQKIINGYQVEVPDQWLRLGNVWEIRKPKHAIDVKFWGRIEMRKDEKGEVVFDHVDAEHVLAVPYDMPVVGKDTDQTNTLRLWSAEASDVLPKNKDFRQYISEVNEICQNVYPDDSTEYGRFLRLKQQYFFVSAGLQALIKAHLRVYPNLDTFHEKIVMQLNDTHPILAIPELMRILMDDFHYKWDVAWNIVSHSFAYTNHTILSEALERWPVQYIQALLPRIYMIIEEINRRFINELRLKFPNDITKQNQMKIIKDGQVHMAHLGIAGSFSINGVAKLHSDILKNDVLKDFYDLYPEKFNNKTNGITHRRWLTYTNPQLHALLKDTIGDDYVFEPSKLEALMDFVDDDGVQQWFLKIKQERKNILVDKIKEWTGIDVDPKSIFDVHAKRLHAYKRQLLNALYIMYLINEIEADPDFDMHPTTFIFAAKAAPSYYFAKKVIKLIHVLADYVNDNEQLNRFIKVVFIPNYNVSVAEYLMNAADVSKQISTAGKEASGTGNMKFMMNGALTVGTLDGANVEIDQQAGRENTVIFGLNAEEAFAHGRNGYDVFEVVNAQPKLKKVIESLLTPLYGAKQNEFKVIYDELMYRNDEYLLAADFEAFVEAHQEVQRRYQDKAYWAKMCLSNIAKSGYFSSDRTIMQYADDIWKILPLQ